MNVVKSRVATSLTSRKMTHPLTDEMCKQIQLHIFHQTDEDCMRAAYDRGFEDAIEIIEQRGLAHWSALYEAQEDFYIKTNQQEE